MQDIDGSSEKRSKTGLMIGAVAVIAVVGGLVFWLSRPVTPPPPAALTPEAKAYVKNLQLSDFEMKASESYMQSMLVEITGRITNNGDRALRLVEINCVFYDPYGQVVTRERVPIVRKGVAGLLKPQDTRTFRLPFDAIPASWNQSYPQLVIAHIEFEN